MEMKFEELLCWIEEKLQSREWKGYVINITFKKYIKQATRITKIINLFMKYNKKVNIDFY